MTPSSSPARLLPRLGPFVLVAVLLLADFATKQWAATHLASAVHPVVVQKSDGPTLRVALEKRGWTKKDIDEAVQTGQTDRYVALHGLDPARPIANTDLGLDLVVLSGTGLNAPRRWRPLADDVGATFTDVLAASWRVSAADVPKLLQNAWRLESRVPDVNMPLVDNEIVAIRDHSIRFFEGFSLVYAENFGAAWSFLATAPPIVRRALFVTISTVASLAMAWLLWRRRMGSVLSTWALAVILSGAAGNLIDRAFFGGGVVDFLLNYVVFDDTSFWGRTFGPGLHAWPVYNVADIAISVGVILVALDSLRQPKDGPAPAGDA